MDTKAEPETTLEDQRHWLHASAAATNQNGGGGGTQDCADWYRSDTSEQVPHPTGDMKGSAPVTQRDFRNLITEIKGLLAADVAVIKVDLQAVTDRVTTSEGPKTDPAQRTSSQARDPKTVVPSTSGMLPFSSPGT
ncbi:Hypothetical predicted protein [Pelobates cultripes]|uniref:Uncharacterized protein n=1 Tax=Pelobates cultripes TaxID=61616 RepID=A0AAD1RWE1_PELCU|nr:Hypothetical predicted protein [Pelobates cultripes]